MSDPIKHLDQFVEHRKQRFLWRTAGSIFLAASGFIVYTLMDLPQQNALIEQDRATAIRYAQITAKLELVPKVIWLAVDGSLQAAKFFQSEIEPFPTAQGINQATVTEAGRLTAEARNGINALSSVLDSLQLGESDADTIIAKFRDDLPAVDLLLVNQEQVIDAIQAGDPQTASALLRKKGTDPDGKVTRQLNAFAFRTSAFAQMTETKKREYAADLEARRVRRRNYDYRLCLVVLSSVYICAFLVIAARAWRRERSSSKAKVESTESPSSD